MPEGFEGKPRRLIEKESQMASNDSGVVYEFSRDFMASERCEILLGVDFKDLLAVDGRTITPEHYFNNQRGLDHGDNTLPYANELDGLEATLDAYYERRGWTDDGVIPFGNVPA